MAKLYPAIQPYANHEIEVASEHKLHVEESGNAKGVPVIFLHTGPGLSADPIYRRFFDPEHYRIIMFDQRGCGASQKHGELLDNNTQSLVSDIESIVNYLNIASSIIFGDGWGGLLALLYAIAFPHRVRGLIIRGCYAGGEEDIKWLYSSDGIAAKLHPEKWEQFVSIVPAIKKNDIVGSYYDLLQGEDDVARMAAAKAWTHWYIECATLEPSQQLERNLSNPRIALNFAKLSNYYLVNKFFLQELNLWQNIPKISNIPGVIIHGRYDLVSPLSNAYNIHKLWGASELMIARHAGNFITEEAMLPLIVKATNSLRNLTN